MPENLSEISLRRSYDTRKMCYLEMCGDGRLIPKGSQFNNGCGVSGRRDDRAASLSLATSHSEWITGR